MITDRVALWELCGPRLFGAGPMLDTKSQEMSGSTLLILTTSGI